MTFDRFWSIYLGNSLRIQRDKISLTILISITFGFVLLTNSITFNIYAFFYDSIINNAPSIVNGTSVNYTIVTRGFCAALSPTWTTAQQILFGLIRTIIPFLIMLGLNVTIVKHIFESRKRIAQLSRAQKRENNFTRAVVLMNGTFLVISFPQFVAVLLNIIFTYSGYPPSSYSPFQISLFRKIALLLSYTFTLVQFWFDLILNSIFKKEIYDFFLVIVRRNRVSQFSQQT